MNHPIVIRPADHAVYSPTKMGKSTIFESPRLLVGLNAFEPGQEHALHAHAGQDKVYQVLEGEGLFLLEGRELPMKAGDLLVAPEGVPHGVRNTGIALLVLAILRRPHNDDAGRARAGRWPRDLDVSSRDAAQRDAMIVPAPARSRLPRGRPRHLFAVRAIHDACSAAACCRS